MYYIKVFPRIKMVEAEDVLNAFYRETQEKGHRIMHTRYTDHGTWLSAIITINDRPNPHKHE